MENSYGIGVRNRYELFYDDDVDPLDLLKKTEKRRRDKNAEKENKAKPTKTKETNSRPTTGKAKIISKESTEKSTIEEGSKRQTEQLPSQHVKQDDDAQQRSPPQPNKVPRNSETRVKFSDREERNNRRNKQDGEKEARENVPPPSQRFENEGGRGGRRGGGSGNFGGGGGGGAVFGRGGRGGRRGGGRGGNFGDFRGKREFDRQSGMVTSGVKAVDKRDGSGSFNWGSDKDQIEEQLQNDQQSDLDTSGENAEKPSSQADDANASSPEGINSIPPSTEEESGSKEEDGPKEMTLDEWKASQKRNKPHFNIRKAGEGENTNQWKKTYVLKKKEKTAGSGGNAGEEEFEEEEEDVSVAHGRRKVLLPIDFQFSDTPTRGRGRGRGRGGPGRGRGMGGARGMRGARYQGTSRQEAPRMDDERDFPSLG